MPSSFFLGFARFFDFNNTQLVFYYFNYLNCIVSDLGGVEQTFQG